jgi:hypothetical protein
MYVDCKTVHNLILLYVWCTSHNRERGEFLLWYVWKSFPLFLGGGDDTCILWLSFALFRLTKNYLVNWALAGSPLARGAWLSFFPPAGPARPGWRCRAETGPGRSAAGSRSSSPTRPSSLEKVLLLLISINVGVIVVINVVVLADSVPTCKKIVCMLTQEIKALTKNSFFHYVEDM